ncbi:MAG: ATPase, T2SS/T4P/T4SS family, partial [archaeon]|nr:ATPase, T2SS/T4P/T4SS family [archaeon]
MPNKNYLKDLMKKVKEAKKESAAGTRADIDLDLPAFEEFKEEKEKPRAIENITNIPKHAQVESPVEAKPVPEKPPEKGSAAETLRGVKELPKQEAPPHKSEAEKDLEKATKKIEVAKYGDVKIYKIPKKPLLYYFVPVPRSTGAEKAIIKTIKEAATRLISISSYKIREPEQRRIVYKQKIIEILRNSPELHIPERRFEFYANAVVREMVGYGIIDPLVRDDKLEEIMVIGPKQPVYLFHRDYEMMASNIEFYSNQEIEDLVNKIAREIGRRVDISAPLLDARLPDGSRVNATIPPASVGGGTLTIRKF